MKLIFDIGYNQGRFSDERLRLHPDRKIIGVEANPRLIPRNNKDPRRIILNRLVSNVDDDKKVLYVSDQSGISSASQNFINNSRFATGSKNIKNISHWNTGCKVQTITLDTLVKNYGVPDFIKIDVQGYQFKVLSGLTKKCNIICFQWHEEDVVNLFKCLFYLSNIGYAQFGIIGYFDQGDVFDGATYSDKGDPFMVQPKKYLSISQIERWVKKICNPRRKVNYGMLFAK